MKAVEMVPTVYRPLGAPVLVPKGGFAADTCGGGGQLTKDYIESVARQGMFVPPEPPSEAELVRQRQKALKL
eukprot:CAMPEP_0118949954 /NCGR_PEP_ID=MMETSP1169-20130426/50569_1 /TAXON_ID=36882 /ORGANISM="Pyramimonas obovata, Strain CCMP722" /LENGTH=71 /DNA_ID=CAMNT_0006896695 /DNA_START=1 /DNA_END=213 /DNA_ORIENTATION=-